MSATDLAWFFCVTTVIVWLLYRHTYNRGVALERRVKALQQRMAMEAESRVLSDRRAALLETAINQHQQRIALLVGQNEWMEQQLRERRSIHLLPPVGSTISRN